jgi:hypothetical protein
MIRWLRTTLTLLAVFIVAGFVPAAAQTPSPTGAKVYFINLKDGDAVNGPFLVQFGLSGMGVAPAGVEKPNTGHHHLLIDTTLTAEQMKEPIHSHPACPAGDVSADHHHGSLAGRVNLFAPDLLPPAFAVVHPMELADPCAESP